MAATIGPEKDEFLCPEEISLPMHDVEDVDRVEHLLQDKYVAKLLVDHLSTIGGGSLKIMTKRILKRSITSALATNYNWTGAKGKSAFQSLKIAAIILRVHTGAVRHNFPQHPHSETEVVIKHLRNAKDRDGGRMNRMNNKSMDDTSTREFEDTWSD